MTRPSPALARFTPNCTVRVAPASPNGANSLAYGVKANSVQMKIGSRSDTGPSRNTTGVSPPSSGRSNGTGGTSADGTNATETLRKVAERFWISNGCSVCLRAKLTPLRETGSIESGPSYSPSAVAATQ